MATSDVSRSNAIRSLKAWGGLRGEISAQLEQTIIPVVAVDEGFPMPVHEPWMWGTTLAASPGFWSVVGFYNKDRRPDDPQGQDKSIVIIDDVRIFCNVATDLMFGIVDAATAGLGTPTSAAAMNAAFQEKVNPPYKVTGVGKIQGYFGGVIGDLLFPMNSTSIDLKGLGVYLGPGHAWTVSPNAANVTCTIWGRGRYYHAP